jgi:hypothetical protein
MLCAVTVMALDGTVAGALYKPDEEIVPVLEFPPIVPFTSQRNLVFFVPETEALNCTVCPTSTVEKFGEIETLVDPLPVPQPDKVRQTMKKNIV